MYVVLHEYHAADLDIYGEPRDVEYCVDLLINLYEYIIGVLLDRLLAVLLADCVSHSNLIQLQLTPHVVHIPRVWFLSLRVHELPERLRMRYLRVPIVLIANYLAYSLTMSSSISS